MHCPLLGVKLEGEARDLGGVAVNEGQQESSEDDHCR